MATINDVCRIAGVSKATVSRVINGTGQVKESTSARVQDAIQQLNYRPSSVAQALAKQEGTSIGLMLSDFSKSYVGTLLKQASLSSEMVGKQLLIADGHLQPEKEIEAIYSLHEKKCGVIVLHGSLLTVEQLIELNHDIDVPMVHVGRQLPPEAGYSISLNQGQLMRAAVTYLIESGHRNITYVGPSWETHAYVARLNSFLECIDQYSDLGCKGQFIESMHGIDMGYMMGKHLASNLGNCTAVICAGDDIAVGCIHAFKEAGINVPADVSVMGIDNDPYSAYMTPALTTMSVPIQEMIDRALHVAKKLITSQEIFLPESFAGELIIRESTSAI
ncbi:HTH-type transcriptional regulator AscG [Vibrio stylophorae]|uniref:HTH-type transcriptional regulator AscG n=1 Tax=Vibrio stylophorae TaxID=659351 RepID=A0ABN8DWM9_9VIBR|nr:LacI family DNA-binding transcriptional regulator [Vibrio stylophorae]CAH0534315.1 HTH-type transcriptional regulator AscG [Vibrio stylophorae]